MAINLLPVKEMKMVSPMHMLTTSHVDIDTTQNGGDYHLIDGRPALSKTALMRIASAAGIIWNWRESGVVNITPTYVCYKAIGFLRLPDGTPQPIMGMKEIDLAVIEDEIYEKHIKKGLEENSARAATRKELIQWRKNKVARAETGALLRCVRAVLGLKSTYTMQELKEGFTVPRIDFTPDFNDPQVRQMLMQQAYGSPQQIAAPIQRPALMAPPEDIIDCDAVDVSNEEPAKPPQSPAKTQDAAEQPATQTPEKPAQNPPPAQTNGATEALVCKRCGRGVTAGVASHSQEEFGAGEIYCWKPCQQEERAERAEREANAA